MSAGVDEPRVGLQARRRRIKAVPVRSPDIAFIHGIGVAHPGLRGSIGRIVGRPVDRLLCDRLPGGLVHEYCLGNREHRPPPGIGVGHHRVIDGFAVHRGQVGEGNLVGIPLRGPPLQHGVARIRPLPRGRRGLLRVLACLPQPLRGVIEPGAACGAEQCLDGALVAVELSQDSGLGERHLPVP
jgi:hypothetical protein